jgi:hypothetical protein
MCPQKIAMWEVQKIEAALKTVRVQGSQGLGQFMLQVCNSEK